MDEAIAQLVAFTGATPERAAQYLQVTDGDVEQAASLYMESDGADLGGPASSTSQPPSAPSRPTGTGNASNPINLDDDNISDDNDPQITGFQKAPQPGAPSTEDDEAMARRLQEEMYGATGGDIGDQETVRAPIARHVETLAGPGTEYYGGSGLQDAVQERMRTIAARGQRRQTPGIFNQQPTSRIWNEADADEREALARATGGASEANARANYLARLFAPNWELMFEGSWEDARDLGKEEKKWLLVNIQNEKVFDCQVLNRDIWKNDGIIDTVKENFVFLQYSKDDPRSEEYCNYYFHNAQVEDEYPHVAIVDPRTGEQVKLWSRKVPGPAEFLMQLHEFLDRYSLDNSARNPVAKRKSELKKEKPVELLTEEEQLERALQASMAGTSGAESLKIPEEDPDDLTRSISDLREKPVEDEVMAESINGTNGTPVLATNPFSSIPSDKPHEEPPAGPNVTRIQLRHPGGRVVRRFTVSDPVQRIYEYLKAEPLEEHSGKEFELVAMGKNLISSREETIEEAGLKNGTIMIEFVDS